MSSKELGRLLFKHYMKGNVPESVLKYLSDFGGWRYEVSRYLNVIMRTKYSFSESDIKKHYPKFYHALLSVPGVFKKKQEKGFKRHFKGRVYTDVNQLDDAMASSVKDFKDEIQNDTKIQPATHSSLTKCGVLAPNTRHNISLFPKTKKELRLLRRLPVLRKIQKLQELEEQAIMRGSKIGVTELATQLSYPSFNKIKENQPELAKCIRATVARVNNAHKNI
ncbi:MAG: hypothetical protein AAF558_04590 [Verrucomicrobiota bacterium]